MITILGERQGEPVPTTGELGDDKESRDRERWLDFPEQRTIDGLAPRGRNWDGARIEFKGNYHRPVIYKVIGVYPRSSAADYFYDEEWTLP